MGPTIKWTRDGTGQMGWVVNVDMVHMDCVNKNYSNPRKRGESWSSLRGSTLTGYLSVISPWPLSREWRKPSRNRYSKNPKAIGIEAHPAQTFPIWIDKGGDRGTPSPT
jgi:hypothetical protein